MMSSGLLVSGFLAADWEDVSFWLINVRYDTHSAATGRNLFLTFHISSTRAHIESSQTNSIQHFCENSLKLKVVNHFRGKASS